MEISLWKGLTLVAFPYWSTSKPEQPKANGTLNIEQLEIENQKTKQRLERLRGEVGLSMGINDLRKEREHVKSLIQKTDERIDILMKELRKTEPRTEVSA